MPQEFLDYLNSEEFAGTLLHNVLKEQLLIDDATSRPAGHYVQQFDPAISVDNYWGVELTLSKISVRDGRNFGGALKAMEEVLTNAVKRFIPEGKLVQIFCIIATDAPVYGTNSTLFEMDEEIWVTGAA